MRNVILQISKISCLFFLLTQMPLWAQTDSFSVSNGSTQLRFNTISNTIEIADTELGTVLYNGVFEIHDSAGQFCTTDKTLPWVIEANPVKNQLTIKADGKVNIVAKCDQEHLVTITSQSSNGDVIHFQACATADSAITALTQKQKAADCNVLFTTLGTAELDTNALYDTKTDSVILAQSPANASWKWNNGWQLHAGANSDKLTIAIQITPHYYRDELGLGYFAPLQKTSFWHTAPTVALTWYSINTYGGDSRQKKEWLYPQIDYVSKYLLPYAGKLVFQLDDNYDYSDDKYMRDISDYIRSKGLIPGIWFTPFSLVHPSVAKSHPDWFLHDKAGQLITNFGGCNWGFLDGAQTYVINVNNPDAVQQWYGMFWHKVSETWNYDYFKLDAAPNALQAYSTSIECGGPCGYQKGLQIARRIIGPDKFINNCTGPLPAAFGLTQGTRTGVDTAPYDHAVDVIQRWNFLNNIVLWCDADAIANSYQKTTEIIRLNVTARALTGQQFLTDDMWTRMSPPVLDAMQKGIPTLAIYPANLYRIDNWQDYDTFDLKVGKNWGCWDIAALFNYTGSAASKTLDLSKLRLPSEFVYVFEYWSSKYLGRFERNAKLGRYLMPYDAQVFAIVPALNDRPALLSTSRHVSQGALDLVDVNFSGNKEEWTVTGTSANLVAGKDYELVFAGLNYAVAQVKSQTPYKVISENGIIRVSFNPVSSTAAWQITFKPITKPSLTLIPEQIQLKPGQNVQFQITNLGPDPAQWKISSSDARVSISPAQGELASWPASAKITAALDANSITEPGIHEIVLTAAGSENSKCQSLIAVPVLSNNLARNAKITVSSCASGFDPNFALDSDTHTAWCAAVKDKDGAWIELNWDKPIQVSRIVLDECTAQFKQITQWHLEIEQNGTLKPVSSGTILERRKSVQLDKPCLTNRVRFVIDKSQNMPGLWEFEIYNK